MECCLILITALTCLVATCTQQISFYVTVLDAIAAHCAAVLCAKSTASARVSSSFFTKPIRCSPEEDSGPGSFELPEAPAMAATAQRQRQV